jgi:hypothetical protein
VLSDEELGAALRSEMRALTDRLNPSARLIEQVQAIGASPRSRLSRWLSLPRRRVMIAIPVPALAVIATVVVLFSGSTAAPISAITLLDNGNIRVTIGQLMGVKSANAELQKLGIHKMVVVPMSASCPLHPSMSYFAGSLIPAPKITLTPETVSSAWTIVIAAEKIGPNKVENAIGRFRHHYVPRCVTSHGVGPGLGNWEPTKADRIK